jgi:hypothetical protein
MKQQDVKCKDGQQITTNTSVILLQVPAMNKLLASMRQQLHTSRRACKHVLLLENMHMLTWPVEVLVAIHQKNIARLHCLQSSPAWHTRQ